MTTTMTTAQFLTEIEPMIAARRERDSKLAANAVKRSDKYLAFFASDRFARFAIAHKLDVASALADRCDKTLDRFMRVSDALIREDLTLKNERDQNRYTFGLAQTLVQSVNRKLAVSKTDILATGSKAFAETASEFVSVSRRTMSDSTAERQTGLAQYALEILGFITRSRTVNGQIEIVVNTRAPVYKRFVKLLATA